MRLLLRSVERAAVPDPAAARDGPRTGRLRAAGDDAPQRDGRLVARGVLPRAGEPVSGVRERSGLAAGTLDDSIRRLRAVATALAARSGARAAAIVLARAAQGPAAVADAADGPAAAGRADFPRQRGAVCAAGGGVAEAAGLEPRAGRDVVHDVAGRLGGAAGTLLGPAGCGGGRADRDRPRRETEG